MPNAVTLPLLLSRLPLPTMTGSSKEITERANTHGWSVHATLTTALRLRARPARASLPGAPPHGGTPAGRKDPEGVRLKANRGRYARVREGLRQRNSARAKSLVAAQRKAVLRAAR